MHDGAPRRTAGLEGREEPQRLADPQALRQRGLLELGADVLAEGRRLVDRVEAEHVDAAGVGRAQALDALDAGRLPGTVGPEKPEDLPLPHLEGDVRDRLQVSVALREVVDHDDFVHPTILLLLGCRRSNGRLPPRHHHSAVP